MTTTKFNMVRDINGYNGFGLPDSNTKFSATLVASTDESFTVPSDAENYLVLFSIEPGSRVWVCPGATAAVPGGGTFATTTSELNPVARKYAAGTIVHCITPDDTADVGVCIYALQ
jgi:hypothetical protein